MGDSIPISDRANQKDTTATDQVYPGNSAPQRGSSRLAARAAGVGRGGAHGGSRSREDDADWPAATMATRCWGQSAWATTTAARDGATPSILHGERGEGGARREKTRSAA